MVCETPKRSGLILGPQAVVFGLVFLMGPFLAQWPAANAQAEPYDIIICGSGGQEEYESKFSAWGNRLRRVLIEKLGHPETNVELMMEAYGEEEEGGIRETSLENIRSVFSEISQKVSSNDDLFVYLIGHGSYLRKISKLNIPGPDLTAEELGELLKTVSARRIILINSSSRSAGFINKLSGPNRIICTATRTVEQMEATEFMEYFIQSLEEGSADQNRDERISVLEACQQAAIMTNAWYLNEGIIPTENALIDDNADGLGTRIRIDMDQPVGGETTLSGIDPGTDGRLAARCFLKDFAFPDSVPKEMIATYLNLLAEIDQLKNQKASIDLAQYYSELENLLVKAAKTNREIRRLSASET